jgi:hypothetical protein
VLVVLVNIVPRLEDWVQTAVSIMPAATEDWVLVATSIYTEGPVQDMQTQRETAR